jgi:hypothetical protein
MKNYFEDFFYFYHKLVLIFFSAIIVVSSILYYFNFTHYNRNLYLILYVLILFLITYFLREKKILFKLFLCLILFLISSYVSGNIYDLSADGRSAHLKNNFFHLNNYNPFYDPCGISVKKNNELFNFFNVDTYNAKFASHSIIFLENIFVLSINNVEAAKSLKIFIFLMSFYPVSIFLNEFKLLNKFKILFFFAILFNSILITQFIDSYKDFYGYYLILNSLIFFYLIIKKNFLNKEEFFLLLLNLFLLSATKFNFYIFSILFSIFFSIAIFFKFKVKKIIYLTPLFLLFLTMFGNFTPAVKTFFLNNKLFVSQEEYLKTKPSCWDTDINVIIDTRPKATKFNDEKGSVYKLFHGLLTKGSIEEYANYPIINKNDLYKINKNDFYLYFKNAVPFYGGGGPFFGKIFIILLLFSLILIIKNASIKLYRNFLKENRFELGLIIIIFLSILVFPYPNIFRFVPHVWLLAILIFLLYFKLKIKSFVVNILFSIFILNIISVLYFNILGAFYGQIMFKKVNKIFFDNLELNENINGWVSNWGYQLYQYSLISNNFNIKNFKSADMARCMNVYNVYNTEGAFCLDGLVNQEKIKKEINNVDFFYKSTVYRLSGYLPKDVTIIDKK